jgi:hypothetical protein
LRPSRSTPRKAWTIQKPDPAQLFLDRTRQYINSMVARYHDAQAKLLLQKFNGATPEKQTAALQALDAA